MTFLIRWAVFIVMRTDPYVFDWRGNRIMAKYKIRDL